MMLKMIVIIKEDRLKKVNLQYSHALILLIALLIGQLYFMCLFIVSFLVKTLLQLLHAKLPFLLLIFVLKQSFFLLI